MSAPAYTLAQLLTPQNLDVIRTRLLASFQGAGFPAITEWQPKNGVEMGFVTMVGSSVADMIAADLPSIIAGGFLGEAAELSGDASAWLDLLTETVYLLSRVPATSTTFNMDMLVALTAQPYTWNVGDVEIIAPTGNRYRNTTAATGQPGSFATLTFQAEAPGASYADDPGSGFQLVTTFAGVTLRPTAAAFSSVIHTGTSTGQITPILVGAPQAHAYAIRIDVSGDCGTAQWSYQADGGAWVPMGIVQTVSAVFNGISTRAQNGSGTPTSFIAGDQFFFSQPGGTSYVQGSDAETNTALAQRCRLRWPSLSLNPTDGLFQLWAILAVPSASRIQVAPDLASDPTAIPGRVRMWVADSKGPIDPKSLAIINAYIQPKMSVLDSFLASGAVPAPITALGTVLVTPATLVSVQQAAEKGWAAYLGSLPLGGVVELSKLTQVVMDAGALNITGTFLNGFAENFALAPGQVPTEAATLISSLVWSF